MLVCWFASVLRCWFEDAGLRMLVRWFNIGPELALKELNLNNRGCKPVGKGCATDQIALKGLNINSQYLLYFRVSLFNKKKFIPMVALFSAESCFIL